MAMLQMNKICICAMKKERKGILEFLQRQGCVEVDDAQATDGVFETVDTSTGSAAFLKNAETARLSLEVLNRYFPEKRSMTAFLHGRRSVNAKENVAFCQRRNDVLKTAQRILALDCVISETKAVLVTIEAKEEALLPWMRLPVPQTFRGTKKTTVFIGSVGGEYTPERLLTRLSEAAPGLETFHLEIVYTSKERTCFYMVVLKEEATAAEAALHALGFSAPVSPSHHMPQTKKEHLHHQKEDALEVIAKAECELEGYVGMREELRYLEDHMIMRAEKYEIISRLMHTRHAFVLKGYLPERESNHLRERLTENFACVVETTSAADDQNAPVMLQNASFSAPLEPVLESYSIPSRGEIDPTPVMSVFYYIMFGLMFSDAGYGLIMAGVCGACLLLFKNMPPNWRKNLGLFFWCGVSTVFWGVIFSSYFGDVVNVFSKTFLGHVASIPPVWFAPLNSPMKLMIFCMGIGIVHLISAYVMRACNFIKNRLYIDVVYDVVFPVLILLCLVIILMGSDMFYGMAGFRLFLTPASSKLCLSIAALCMAGVVLTGGRESKNWFKRILKGLYALYNVLAGWLGDILSYSRLLALGLATGVIASVINALGTMSGNGVMGFLVFIVVFILGHTINFGINALGAYVHSNRLEYVEFLGKFYEGGGRKFAPFGMHTKYYLVEEEDLHV